MKLICSASALPDAHGPLIVRVLTTAAEHQRFDALLAAEHFLGPRFPADDRLYQVAEQDDLWVGLLLWCAPTDNVLRDLLGALDLDAFADVLTRWLQSQAGRLPASLALDGKTIRDHLGGLVSLVEHERVAARPRLGLDLLAKRAFP